MTTEPVLRAPRLVTLREELTLAEKVGLVTGATMWSTREVPRIGLRRMTFSDGPSGVRGEVWDERRPSLSLPSASALAASWDPGLVARAGTVLAGQAVERGVDVVLGPTINLHRSPRGGRHFEAYSEDPFLTGRTAAAYVAGLQAAGVAACPKHFVGNDSETERQTVDVRMGDRALHEVYLAPFEAAVRAGAWVVMSSYNRVGGTTMTESPLLSEPLKGEWGFDGVVVSDWTAVRSLASASAAQDLAMPGPAGVWADGLLDAVTAGVVDERVLDDKVDRLLLLASRVGALDGGPARPAPPSVGDGRATAREIAREGLVLLDNDGLLPLGPDADLDIVVVGQAAVHPRIQGGGSATVVPDRVVTPLDGITAALSRSRVTHVLGAANDQVQPLDPDRVTDPVTGGPGVRVRLLDEHDRPLLDELRHTTALTWFGGDAPVARSSTVEVSVRWTPRDGGPARVGFAGVGDGHLTLDGVTVLRARVEPEGHPIESVLVPPGTSTPVEVRAGVPVELVLRFRPSERKESLANATGVTLGAVTSAQEPQRLIAEAALRAARADVAVVCVGTDAGAEAEGRDRRDLRLPGHQDELVRAVAAANPRTVVVVGSGAPVLTPWRDEVAAVLLSWFAGQEGGTALGEVLAGVAEPGGRLPTTWPAAEADVPVLDVRPVDGVLDYAEGVHVGHRGWLRSGATPAWPFGHGLGYTTWEIGGLRVPERHDAHGPGPLRLATAVTNTGDRPGKCVLQVYASRPAGGPGHPARTLVGYAVVRSGPGVTTPVEIDVEPRELARRAGDGWVVDPGPLCLAVGRSVTDLPVHATVELV
ncbi:beta-glucosidase family protein [Pseudonocardia alni]|uniref:beta-glucosidase family protein n=1 Tax=Pseudonocardia alni TaxID=33907 RepID=UPI003319F38F